MRTTKLLTLMMLGLGVLRAPVLAADPSDPTATMFDPTRVLEISIQMDPDKWNQLRAQERTFVSLFGGKCLAQPFDHPFTWFPAVVSIDGQERVNVGVRKKGFLGSLDTIKPALRIDLEEFEDNDAIYGVKKLTLNNAKQDPSLIRQCLAYQLFTQAGLPAPRCNFARVSVNGQDRGIYVNVEEVRKPMLARHFADNSGNLYEGTVSDFHPALVKTFEVETNEDTNHRSDLAAVSSALRVNDARLLRVLGSVVDLDAFTTFWAMEGLIGIWDGYSSNRNNFYLYSNPASGKFHFIPWGADVVLADGSPLAAMNPAANTAMFAYSAITRRLVDLPTTFPRYKARMQTLLDGVWSEAAILAEIDRMKTLLLPYAGDLTTDIAPVRSFVEARRARIAQELGNGPPTFPPLTIISPCLVRNGAISGSFVASWGTFETVPPLQTGVAVLDGKVSGVKLDTNLNGADAGLALADPNPHKGFINLYVERSNGTFAVVSATLDSTLLVPGAYLTIDGQQVNATLVFTDGVTIGGFLDHGTLSISSASTAPGGQISGTFNAKSYFFSGRHLAP